MPETTQYDSQYDLITSLYDPHVVINWKDRPSKPFNVNIHLLKSGAGDELGKMFPQLTGLDRSRAIVNITSVITKAITDVRDVNEHTQFVNKCNEALNAQFGTRKPTAKELYDYNVAFTKDLQQAGFMPTQDKVNDIVMDLLNAHKI
ncbi:MAG: hypothetical protein NC114_06760 [Ruminococcus flavefaciens]|nr:hypothetical protein [Ruminococcus flavefaciens]